MPRGEDRTSLAAQYTRTPEYYAMICELTLEEARKKLELFEKHFPSVYKLWSRQPQFLHDEMILSGTRIELTAALQELCTERQPASQGPAKSPLVSSTPTPCSISEGPPEWEKV